VRGQAETALLGDKLHIGPLEAIIDAARARGARS